MIGKILHINVNPNGGVPKLQVDKASIHKLGLHNDKQNSKHHGGVDRAVLLWSIEEISKLQKEGISITPGSAGENLTVEGLEWDQLKKGDIIRVGRTIVGGIEYPGSSILQLTLKMTYMVIGLINFKCMIDLEMVKIYTLIWMLLSLINYPT